MEHLLLHPMTGLFLSLPLSLSVCLSPSLSRYLCLSLSLSRYLCLSLSVSPLLLSLQGFVKCVWDDKSCNVSYSLWLGHNNIINL